MKAKNIEKDRKTLKLYKERWYLGFVAIQYYCIIMSFLYFGGLIGSV